MGTEDEALLERFPEVFIDHTNKAFYRGLLNRELRLHRCDACGWWHHKPKPRCPRCWSDRLTATPISGLGTIYLRVLLHQGPVADGVDYSTPYPVVATDLDEQAGLRFTSTVIGSSNDDIVIGSRVRLDWIERGGRPHPVWRLLEGG